MAQTGHSAAAGRLRASFFDQPWPTAAPSPDEPWREGARLLVWSLPVPLVIAAGIYSDIGAITLVGAGFAIAVALARPSVGLLGLLMVAPLLSEPILPAPGFQFFVVAALILGIAFRLPIERPRLTLPPVFLLLLGYVSYVFVQQLPEMLAGYPGEQLRDIGSMMAKLATALGVIVAAALIVRGRSPYPYLGAMLASVVAASALGVVTYLDMSGLLGGLLADGEVGTRASGVFANPNYFAHFVSMGLLVALCWFAGWGSGGLRWVLAAAIGVMGAALLVSQSRGAMVALAVGIVAAAFARSRRTGFFALLIACLAAAVVVPLVLEFRITQQAGFDYAAAVERQASSDGARLADFALGPEVFLSSPIFGVGLFHFTLETGIYPHNWFVRIFTEQGLVGIILTILILVALVRRFKRLPAMPRSTAFGLLGLVLAASFFLEPQSNIQSVLMLAVTLTIVVAADWSAGRDPVSTPRRKPQARRPHGPIEASASGSGVTGREPQPSRTKGQPVSG